MFVRRLYSMRVALILACGALAACSSDHHDANARVAAAVESSGGDARVQAAAARFRAVREEADSVTGHEDMQLRVNNISGDNLERNEGIEVSLRVPMTNPWEIARAREALNEEAMAMAHAVESEAVEVASVRCAEGLTRSAGTRAADVQRRFREAMLLLQTWSEGWVRGETMGPLESAELVLEIERRLAELVPPAVGAGASVPLPSLDPGAPLDMRTETILARIEAAHPAMQQHAAAARSYRALARRERARAAPWFGFVELGYEFDRSRPSEDNRQAIEARFAITLPLAMRPRHEVARQEARAQAEELDAQAAAEELAGAAARALASVSDFSQRAGSLSGLATRADETEAIALRYLQQREQDPKAVLGVLVEVMRARMTLIDAQLRAGLAACDLYMSTGVSAADWPRQ